MVEDLIMPKWDSDDRQELQEAVCDAVLERTWRTVAGVDERGRIILGDRPSRVLSSGFVLPRRIVDDDDESSDIRIASHGLDLRIQMAATGTVQIRPSFFVYVRALPSNEELFARDGRLVPPAGFSPIARQQLDQQVKARLQSLPENTTRAERRKTQETAARDVMHQMGVFVPEHTRVVDVATESTEQPDGNAPGRNPDFNSRLRIPNSSSRTYEAPQKWMRVPVQAAPLLLPLPWVDGQWKAIVATYNAQLMETTREACTAWIRSPEGLLWAWRPGRVLSEDFWEPAAWDGFLARARSKAPDPNELTPQMEIQLLVDPLIEPVEIGVASLRIALENLQAPDDGREPGVFGVVLSVNLPSAAVVPMRLERVRRSYHLAGFLSMYAVGVNGGVEDRGEIDGVLRLRTTWLPRYVLPRTRATEIATVPTQYALLAEETRDLGGLTTLAEEMRAWIAAVKQDTRLSWPGETGSDHDEAIQRDRFQSDIAAWGNEANLVARGADLLGRSQKAFREAPHSGAAIPYRAWLLLNRAFADANPAHNDLPQPGWRLFQLAFVLAHIPTLASRLPEYEADFSGAFDEASASLLYMSTGGGKTEAFFGTVVYALFLDRLRGKARGVTAMMHYPLRLLTIQQAQRLARLLSKAEMVRRRESLGGAPFEIGFWVGGSNTPNKTELASGQISDELKCVPTWQAKSIIQEHTLTDGTSANREYVAARDAWNKLPFCPFCGNPTGLRLYPERHHRLGIVCTGGGACCWNSAHQGQASPEPLPFLLADTDIYRRAPAVLLGTVDKLALLGQSTHTINRIAGMFGLARLLEGGDDGLLQSPEKDVDTLGPNQERLAPPWASGRPLFFDPFPSLIVQDELHLLDESLGTFGGIFETGLFAWLGRLASLLGDQACRFPGIPDRPRMPHIIGATATVSDSSKHVSALYQKTVAQFPHPGPALHGGFYVRLAGFTPGSEAHTVRTSPAEGAGVHPRIKEVAAPWGRVYASLMTNGRLHTVTTLSVLTAHAATITRWLRDLGSGDPVRQARAAQEVQDSVSDAKWCERRRAAVVRETASGRYDRLARLVDLHRIELTYVTNKKGGDQILSAITGEVAEAHQAMGNSYLLSDYKIELVSGGVDAKGIQSVIRKAEEAFDPMRDDVADRLRLIVATSAISHGVDVDTLNAMAFAGMPSDIAEYIQASSRVGRAHVGFSMLIPTPQARRDRFVVGVHEDFHRLLERMIAPPAVERWADRALQRTIPSLVQTWLAGIQFQAAFVNAPEGTKSSARFPGTVEAVDAIFKGASGPANFDACVDFVCTALGIDAPTGGPATSVDYYRRLVRDGVGAVRAEIGSDQFTGRLMDFWTNDHNPLRRYRPMTSLRDVDETGTIVASPVTLKHNWLSEGDIAAAMAFLRNRGVLRGRSTASSELDPEN